jgi:hypothetical protein
VDSTMTQSRDHCENEGQGHGVYNHVNDLELGGDRGGGLQSTLAGVQDEGRLLVGSTSVAPSISSNGDT